MTRSLPEIRAHLRMAIANNAISTTLIQTDDLEALCDASEIDDSAELARRGAVIECLVRALYRIVQAVECEVNVSEKSSVFASRLGDARKAIGEAHQ